MNRIIVGFKNLTPNEAIVWAKRFRGKVHGFKLNDMLFNELSLINDLNEYGSVMADPKLFDVPEDMENSFRRISDAGAEIITVHLAAGWRTPPDLLHKVCGVTVLTSFDDIKCNETYNASVLFQLKKFVRSAAVMSYPYIVCSAQDLKIYFVQDQIKAYNIKPICPSIRFRDSQIANDYQSDKRKATPSEAIRLGAHYIVVSSPVFKSSDPVGVLDKINEEIDNFLLDNENEM